MLHGMLPEYCINVHDDACLFGTPTGCPNKYLFGILSKNPGGSAKIFANDPKTDHLPKTYEDFYVEILLVNYLAKYVPYNRHATTVK